MQKFLKLLRISIYITAGVTLLNLFFFLDELFSWAVFLRYFGICFLFSFVLTLVNAYYYDGVSIRYDWATQPRTRLWVGAIGSIILSILAFGLMRVFLSLVIYGNSFRFFLENEASSSYVFAIGLTAMISLFLHAFHFYKALQENRVKEQKIIAGAASAKFDALKNQLDPHFLFNSLNVLTSLIEEDPHQAQKFTTSLSKVYRYVLEQKNKDLVSVDEELEFARTYVKLLKMRFEDSIILDIPEKSCNPEAKIVPLSLQLLLENAVKHNIVNSAKPLHIKIFEDDGQLKVTNNLQEKQVVKKSSGVGLQNIQQRYELLSTRKMEIEKTATNFTVILPMLTQKVSIVETQEDFIEDKRYQKAKEKVENIKGFYGNLIAYCIVIPCLAVLNYNTTSFPWIIFPVVGWGFGLLTHGLEAFGYHPLWGKRWEEKKLRQLMEKDDF
ncbi:2TM domain-containing protein [Maribacter sp. CXY002]|uniref:2TM domain-containing protein n=1 Tax=Maribacter luteocoastalis TaxID=3407671 RepID=UPI003B66CC27